MRRPHDIEGLDESVDGRRLGDIDAQLPGIDLASLQGGAERVHVGVAAAGDENQPEPDARQRQEAEMLIGESEKLERHENEEGAQSGRHVVHRGIEEDFRAPFDLRRNGQIQNLGGRFMNGVAEAAVADLEKNPRRQDGGKEHGNRAERHAHRQKQQR